MQIRAFVKHIKFEGGFFNMKLLNEKEHREAVLDIYAMVNADYPETEKEHKVWKDLKDYLVSKNFFDYVGEDALCDVDDLTGNLVVAYEERGFYIGFQTAMKILGITLTEDTKNCLKNKEEVA